MKRRKYPDRSECRTPPLAVDIRWTFLDDDPLGVYTELGGQSNPITPPPLRATKVTSHITVNNIVDKHKEIRDTLADPVEYAAEKAKDDLELKEHLASHDSCIKKCLDDELIIPEENIESIKENIDSIKMAS